VNAFLPKLNELMSLAYEGDESAVRELVSEIVPTFHDQDPSQWIPPELFVESIDPALNTV